MKLIFDRRVLPMIGPMSRGCYLNAMSYLWSMMIGFASCVNIRMWISVVSLIVLRVLMQQTETNDSFADLTVPSFSACFASQKKSADLKIYYNAS